MPDIRAASLGRISKLADRFEASVVDDELVLIDVRSGALFAMKGVALRIWEMLDAEPDLDAICNTLQQEYQVSANECRTETAAFADQLVEAGFARRA